MSVDNINDELARSEDPEAGEYGQLLGDHSYDGIQEYDNPLPGWWKWLFIGSIFFAAFYWVYFESGVEGRSIHDGYDKEMSRIITLRFKEIGELTADRQTIQKYLEPENEKWLAVGKVVYKTNCVGCHGADGGGKVGPNLTDDYWKNVKNLEDIADVIENGAANGSMPAWKTRLSHQNQIVLTAAYIASLRDNPISGKAPEGELIKGWTE